MQKVTVGPTTIAGWLAAVVGVLGALVPYIEGNEALLAGPGKWSAILGALVLIVTQVGRYAQAVKVPATPRVPDGIDGPWVARAEVPATTEVVGSTK